jgi:hypothetical protein
LDLHNFIVRSVVQRNGAYEVRQVEDSFMIVTKSTFEAVAVAVEIQEQLHFAVWPPKIKELGGLRPRMGMHYCTLVEVRFDFREWRFDYRGLDVDLAAAVCGRPMNGGLIATESLVRRLEEDPDFAVVLEHEVSIRLLTEMGSGISGSTATNPMALGLYSIASKELERTVAQRTDAKGGRERRSSMRRSSRSPPEKQKELPELESEVDLSPTSMQRPLSDMEMPHVAKVLLATLSVAKDMSPTAFTSVVSSLLACFRLDAKCGKSLRRMAAGMAAKVCPNCAPKRPAYVAEVPVGGLEGMLTTGTQSGDEGPCLGSDVPKVTNATAVSTMRRTIRETEEGTFAHLHEGGGTSPPPASLKAAPRIVTGNPLLGHQMDATHCR